MSKVGNAIDKAWGHQPQPFKFYFLLQHINDLSLHIELDSTLSKVEGIYRQVTLAVQLPDVARKIIGLEPLGDNEGGEEQESVWMGNIDNRMESEQDPESLEAYI
jgi:hypothetical protein